MNTINAQTMATVATSLLFVADAAIAESFLDDFCKDNKGYVIPAANSKEKKEEGKAWQAAFLKAGAKQASLSNLRTALNYGLEAGRFLGANPARAKEALASLNKASKAKAENEKDKGAKSSADKGAKPGKSDVDKLKGYAKQVLESPALKAADFPTITREEWAAMLRCLTKIKA